GLQFGGDVLYGRTYQGTLTSWRMPGLVGRGAVWLRGRIEGLVAAPGGDIAAEWTDSGEGVLWRPSSGELMRRFRGRIRDARLSDKGDRFAIIGGDRLSAGRPESPSLAIDLPSEYEEKAGDGGKRLLWVKAKASELTLGRDHFQEAV